MAEFRTDIDVCNRALQHCGASRINPVLGFSENSKNAAEVQFCYGKLREAELRRNVWTFATRRTMLRAIDTGTMLLAAGLYVPTTTYFVGSIVADQYQNLWISRIPDNTGNDPLLTSYWEPYFGPLTVSLFDSGISYFAGELVYTAPGDGTARIYLSLQSGNEDVPATPTAYDATATYSKNQVVTSAAIAYMSLVDLNTGNTPASSPGQWTTSFVGGAGSAKWLQIGGAGFPMGVGLTTLNITYPLGTGPSSHAASRNIYKLPAGFLREASQNPKSGVTTWLGAPSGITYNDWVFENGYLLSSDPGAFAFRFVANITDVSLMDPMFCEGLAARVALEVCEPLTQSSAKLGTIAKIYDAFMSEARTVNAIEQGTEQPPDDDFITVRL